MIDFDLDLEKKALIGKDIEKTIIWSRVNERPYFRNDQFTAIWKNNFLF